MIRKNGGNLNKIYKRKIQTNLDDVFPALPQELECLFLVAGTFLGDWCIRFYVVVSQLQLTLQNSALGCWNSDSSNYFSPLSTHIGWQKRVLDGCRRHLLFFLARCFCVIWAMALNPGSYSWLQVNFFLYSQNSHCTLPKVSVWGGQCPLFRSLQGPFF